MIKIRQILPRKYKLWIGEGIDLKNNIRLQHIKNHLIHHVEGIIDITISYNCLLIEKDKDVDVKFFEEEIEKIDDINLENSEVLLKVIDIPVCYDGEFALDIDIVSKHCNLSRDDIVKIHTSKLYYIYFIGFLPGFPYLGGLDKSLFTPRKDTPRKLVKEGSVGIGGSQTGIYPIDSPGGWQIIGRTPIKIFDYNLEKPFMFDTGMGLRFFQIDSSDYYEIKNRNNDYSPKIYKVNLSEVI